MLHFLKLSFQICRCEMLLGGKKGKKGGPGQPKAGETSLSKACREKVKALVGKTIYTSGQLEKIIDKQDKEMMKDELFAIWNEEVNGVKYSKNLKICDENDDKTTHDAETNITESLNSLKIDGKGDGNPEQTITTPAIPKNAFNRQVAQIKPNGLSNLGNTCFLNSVTQCLANIPELQTEIASFLDDKVENLDFPITKRHPKFHRPLLNVINNIKSPRKGSASPKDLLSAVQSEHKQFAGRRQQDSHELFSCLVHSMKTQEEGVLRVSLMDHLGVKVEKVQKKPISAELKKKSKEMYISNKVKFPACKYFSGKVCYLTECNGCGTISNYEDNFSALSLSIPVKGQLGILSQKTKAVATSDDNSEDETPPEETEMPDSRNNSKEPKGVDMDDLENAFLNGENPFKKSEKEIPVKKFTIPDSSDDSDTDTDSSLTDSIKDHIKKQAANRGMMENCLWNIHSEEERRNLLAKNLSVYGCLVNNSRSEIMKGNNMIDCENCKSKQLASRLCVLKELPEILVLHLKRYRQVTSGKSARLVKDSSKINIDKELEIKGQKFILTGIVEHTGALNSGHYIAVTRSILNPDVWFYCSDSNVKLLSKLSTVNPYMLFYRKVKSDEKKEI